MSIDRPLQAMQEAPVNPNVPTPPPPSAVSSAEVPERASVLASLLAMGKVLHISFPTVVDSMLDRLTIATADRRMKAMGDFIIKSAQATMVVEGLENLDPTRAYLYMSNHESLMDIPLIFAGTPRPPRMVTKKELFRVPIWGKALKLAGFISIDRKDRARAIESLQQAKDLIAQGVNVWMAPEGTRSRDGSLLPFKKGGFMLAIDLGLTIVPVGIQGARRIMRPKTFRTYLGQTVHLRFGKPIDASEYGMERREELVARVRTEIDALRGPAPRD